MLAPQFPSAKKITDDVIFSDSFLSVMSIRCLKLDYSTGIVLKRSHLLEPKLINTTLALFASTESAYLFCNFILGTF